MTHTAKNYYERLTVGKTFPKTLPLAFLYIPFIYLTALIGCWKDPDDFDSYRLGGVEMSMYSTMFSAGVFYALLGRVLLELVLT